jgi:broad specificity phosphatase PhoE
MRLFVVRHAHAGDRAAWDGPDRGRPLSRKGRRQADGLAQRFAAEGIGRVVSSPATRCVQTLEPLAARLGLAVEDDVRLLEGASLSGSLALAAELRDAGAAGGPDAVALCSHGDVIPELVRALRDGGCRVEGPMACQKASAWVIGGDGDRFLSARYLAPPGKDR